MIARENGLKAAIEADRTMVGAAAITGEPLVVELLGDAGADFVWVDLEHGGGSPYDASLLGNLTRAAQAGSTELMVRIPAPDPALIRKVLDTGVRTVLVPRIETAAEVARAIDACRFAADGAAGDRGLAPCRANSWGTAFDGYVDREDGSVLLGAMIENETAVENLEEIIALPDLGFVFVGPADLSVSVGRPMRTADPAVADRIERIEGACRDRNVPLAGIVVEGQDAGTLRDRGYQLITVGADVTVLGERFAERFGAIDR